MNIITPVRQPSRPILSGIIDAIIYIVHPVTDVLSDIRQRFMDLLGEHVTLEIGDLCTTCREIYTGKHFCRHQLAAWCQDCQFYRNVDTWLHCESCGSKSISGLHIKYNALPLTGAPANVRRFPSAVRPADSPVSAGTGPGSAARRKS